MLTEGCGETVPHRLRCEQIVPYRQRDGEMVPQLKTLLHKGEEWSSHPEDQHKPWVNRETHL